MTEKTMDGRMQLLSRENIRESQKRMSEEDREIFEAISRAGAPKGTLCTWEEESL